MRFILRFVTDSGFRFSDFHETDFPVWHSLKAFFETPVYTGSEFFFNPMALA